MSEGPAEKRARVLSAGPKRKRDTPEAAAQQRAYSKSNRRKKLEPEVQAIAEKISEIRKLEEKITLVELLKTDRNRPYHEAFARVTRIEAELAAAKDHLEQMKTAGMADVSDLTFRQENLRASIARLQEEIETAYKAAIDTSTQDSA